MTLDTCVASNNGTNGVVTVNPLAVIRLTNVSVINNTTGLSPQSGGQIVSFGNNRIAGNTTNGAPTQTIAQQ